MKGVVNSVEQRTSQTGKVFWMITVEGQSYSTFNKKAPELVSGDVIEFEYQQNGAYKNIKTFEVVGKPKENTPPATAPKSDAYNNTNNDERARAMALSYAKDLVMHGAANITTIYDLANEFTVYIKTGQAPKPNLPEPF